MVEVIYARDSDPDVIDVLFSFMAGVTDSLRLMLPATPRPRGDEGSRVGDGVGFIACFLPALVLLFSPFSLGVLTDGVGNLDTGCIFDSCGACGL